MIHRPERYAVWFVTIKEDFRDTKVFPLVDHAVSLLGRSSQCDIHVHSRKVSRHQLGLRPVESGVELTVDPNATGHCKIQGKRLTPGVPVVLSSGDRVWISNVEMVIGYGEMPPQPEDNIGGGRTEEICFSSEQNMTPDHSGDGTSREEQGEDSWRVDVRNIDHPEGTEPRSQNHVSNTHAGTCPLDDAEPDGDQPSRREESLGSDIIDETGQFTASLGRASHQNNTSGISVSTRAIGTNEETRYPAAPSEAAEEAECGATSFLPADEARRVIKAAASKRRKQWLMWLAAIGAIFVVWQQLSSSLDASSKTIHTGTYFSLELESDWSSRSAGSGGSVFFGRRPEGREGLALLRGQGDEVWAYDYQQALNAAWTVLSEDFPVLDDVTWEGQWGEYDQEEESIQVDTLPSISSDGVDAIPYHIRQGRIGGKGSVLIRVYISLNQWVVAAVWNNTRHLTKAEYSALDSIQLHAHIMRPDFVRRDVIWRESRIGLDEVGEQLEDAKQYYRQRAASLENSWKAYAAVLEVLRLYVGQPPGEEMSQIKDLWQRYLITYAHTVQDEYRRRTSLITAGQKKQDYDRVLNLALEIQEIIPDPKDPRWIWARRQEIDARSKHPDRRGFL